MPPRRNIFNRINSLVPIADALSNIPPSRPVSRVAELNVPFGLTLQEGLALRGQTLAQDIQAENRFLEEQEQRQKEQQAMQELALRRKEIRQRAVDAAAGRRLEGRRLDLEERRVELAEDQLEAQKDEAEATAKFREAQARRAQERFKLIKRFQNSQLQLMRDQFEVEKDRYITPTEKAKQELENAKTMWKAASDFAENNPDSEAGMDLRRARVELETAELIHQARVEGKLDPSQLATLQENIGRALDLQGIDEFHPQRAAMAQLHMIHMIEKNGAMPSTMLRAGLHPDTLAEYQDMGYEDFMQSFIPDEETSSEGQPSASSATDAQRRAPTRSETVSQVMPRSAKVEMNRAEQFIAGGGTKDMLSSVNIDPKAFAATVGAKVSDILEIQNLAERQEALESAPVAVQAAYRELDIKQGESNLKKFVNWWIGYGHMDDQSEESIWTMP